MIGELAVPVAPVWALCLLLGTGWALLVDLLRPRELARLLHLLLASLFGTIAGQVLAEQLGLARVLIGELHVVEASVGAILALLFARRLLAW
ncbi:MAG: hypothetical protein HYY04_09290 [Chloroflexi bacterium]|nr:hypothetical protein [Chloroflexota bacterium]